MEYHQPHHLMATVPHYKLRRFHERLLQDSEYAEKAQIVEGLFGRETDGKPTAFGVLLKEHAPKSRAAIHVDETVLERADLSDRAALEREKQDSLLGQPSNAGRDVQRDAAE
jgi:hypothetical protein